MKPTIKEVVTLKNWIIRKVVKGYNGRVRIDAVRRFHIADTSDFFSEWATIKYINQCRRNEGLRDIAITDY